ncbi:unnamed protein product [Heligmosomoides polygyrus]|uniref:DUF1771 domain-containing protein n=1 Tax=Heligmosomoides polygyrus TaxID=6339 RepID=A0A183FMP2_HELPZ|nr:unnamed protein product [Heligmosomoides polygyrus]
MHMETAGLFVGQVKNVVIIPPPDEPVRVDNMDIHAPCYEMGIIGDKAMKAAKKAGAVAKAAHYYELSDTSKRTMVNDIFIECKARHRKTEDIEKHLSANDENVHLVINRKRAMKQWHDYIERIAAVEFSHPPIHCVPPTHGLAQKITIQETEATLKKMKPGKATGPDDIAADLWKLRCWNPPAE